MLSGSKSGEQVSNVTPTEGSQVNYGAAQTCVSGVKRLRVVFQIPTTRKCCRKNQGTG